MIGFNLRISELKGKVTADLIEKSKTLKYPNDAEFIRKKLQGKTLFFTGYLKPWASVLTLIDKINLSEAKGSLLYNGGYPYLLAAKGEDIIIHIANAENSKHSEIETLLDPNTDYLIEAWDLS